MNDKTRQEWKDRRSYSLYVYSMGVKNLKKVKIL